MDTSSSTTLRFIVGEANNAPSPTQEEAFALLERTVKELEESLPHVITKTLHDSWNRLDEDLALIYQSQEHPLSQQRLLLVYSTSSTREGFLDWFFLTKSREWWWLSKKNALGHPQDTMELRRLKPKHGHLFSVHTSDSLFIRLMMLLLQEVDRVAEERMERARLMAESTEKPWKWFERTRETGVEIFG